VYVRASVATLRSRDVKGLYARESSLSGLTSYEAPERAELTIDTDTSSVEASVAAVLAIVRERCSKL
jgi:adenylylsulfate kinase